MTSGVPSNLERSFQVFAMVAAGVVSPREGAAASMGSDTPAVAFGDVFLHPRGKWMIEKGGEWEDWAPPTLACSLWWAFQGCQAQAGGGALHTHYTSEMYFANLL